MSIFSGGSSEDVEIYIDSKNRDVGMGYVPENFRVTLNHPISKVTKVKMLNAVIPFTYYTTTSLNNILNFMVGATLYTAVLPVGAYNINTFITDLQTIMNNLFAGFTIIYVPEQLQINFANATAFKLVFAGSTMAYSIGLSADTSIGTSITPYGVTNIGGTKSIFIISNRLLTGKVTKPQFNNSNSNVLYNFAVNSGPGDVMVDKNLYNTTIDYAILQKIAYMDFQLVDDNGNQINLNGQDWAITINIVVG